ncbi:MAG: energy-coupling factor transporter transmembrane protein EcfT [Desulfococcaceae bacterium]
MAELSEFAFRPGKSGFHKLDSRFKLICLMLLSLSILHAGFSGLGLFTSVLFLSLLHIRISFVSLIKEMRYFFLLLFFVFLARAIFIPGETIFQWWKFSVTKEGSYEGFLICWRLISVVLLGLCFVCTTRSSEIRGAAEWLLKPVPLIPEKRAGIMLSLLIRFIPLILSQAKETAEAQRARGIELRKNPLYRLKKFAIPFLRRMFEDADRLTVAMEARSYSENRTPPDFSAGKREWISLAAVTVFCAVLFSL